MSDVTMIDLFAGIGGVRLGFERAGCSCVWSNDHDKYAAQTYIENFGNAHHVVADIRTIDAAAIPAADIVCGGFPCQPFSIAGISKKNSLGRPNGFADETQGTMFYEVVRVIDAVKPKAFFLENVKNLETHDGGKTFSVIKGRLEDLGYSVFHMCINAKYFVPQNRERIYIVGFKDRRLSFSFPKIPVKTKKLSDILQKNVDEKYTLTPNLWKYLQNYAAKHRELGHGFGFGMASPDGYARTLSARYYKDGSEILIPQKTIPRRLTPRECARLQGFPDSFCIPVSDTQAYRQFGNSVAVPVVEGVARAIVETLRDQPKAERTYVSEKQLLLTV
jgi:DNA (cytosine-5)-methyltransferase 1